MIGKELKEKGNELKIKTKREKGITLIALVITIVILIILATVSINVVLGEGGLIQRAKQAKELTEQAVLEEQQGLNSLMSEYTNIMSEDSNDSDKFTTVEEAKESGKKFEETEIIKDINGNKITIPQGFKVAKDSGNTVQEGIVIEDVDASTDKNVQGSQYVWIPVGKFIKDDKTESNEIILGRYKFQNDTKGTPTLVQAAYTQENKDNYKLEKAIEEYCIELSNYTGGSNGQYGSNATAYNLGKWIDSVKNNSGYYIGRFEASYASGNSVENYKASSKVSKSFSISNMNYAVGTLWNNIIQLDASKIAINTYKDSKSVQSDLMNSYAWDTAIVYIREAGNINYANETSKSTGITNTGLSNDEVCKINDMASNLSEWTTEKSSETSNSYSSPCVGRGGNYENESYSVSTRFTSFITRTSNTGFRITLYL